MLSEKQAKRIMYLSADQLDELIARERKEKEQQNAIRHKYGLSDDI